MVGRIPKPYHSAETKEKQGFAKFPGFQMHQSATLQVLFISGVRQAFVLGLVQTKGCLSSMSSAFDERHRVWTLSVPVRGPQTLSEHLTVAFVVGQ